MLMWQMVGQVEVGVLRDSDGRLIFVFYKEFGEVDALQVEVLV